MKSLITLLILTLAASTALATNYGEQSFYQDGFYFDFYENNEASNFSGANGDTRWGLGFRNKFKATVEGKGLVVEKVIGQVTMGPGFQDLPSTICEWKIIVEFYGLSGKKLAPLTKVSPIASGCYKEGRIAVTFPANFKTQEGKICVVLDSPSNGRAATVCHKIKK